MVKRCGRIKVRVDILLDKLFYRRLRSQIVHYEMEKISQNYCRGPGVGNGGIHLSGQ